MPSWIRTNNAKNRKEFSTPPKKTCLLTQKEVSHSIIILVVIFLKISSVTVWQWVMTLLRSWRSSENREQRGGEQLSPPWVPASSSLWKTFTSFQNSPQRFFIQWTKSFKLYGKYFSALKHCFVHTKPENKLDLDEQMDEDVRDSNYKNKRNRFFRTSGLIHCTL